LEFLIGLGGYGDEYAEIKQVLVVVGNAVLDKIARLDGIGQLLVVGAGVLHPLELGAVEADALGHLSMARLRFSRHKWMSMSMPSPALIRADIHPARTRLG